MNEDFVPHRLFRNGHLMTIAAAFWRRRFPRLPYGTSRLFQVEPGTQVLGNCHWQAEPASHPTLVLLHGLEGSSESGYMLGTAEKAWLAGFNVVRLNQRNCGGTEALSATLYNSALSGDIFSVVKELIELDGLCQIFAAGFSMGGNLVLKMAGELAGSVPRALAGIVALAPAFDLAACADALAERRNFLYERHFVRRLKDRMRRKARLFPDRFPIDGMGNIRSVREFDEVITARFCGYKGASDYYSQASARRLLGSICLPTLIITAQDDPFVPFHTFDDEPLRANPYITLLATPYGGHCAFISSQPGEARFWVEGRIVRFCRGIVDAKRSPEHQPRGPNTGF